MKVIQKAIILFGFISVLSSTSVSAASVAFDFTGGIFGATGNITLGYSFSVNAAAINVTDLGWFDVNSDGLNSDHEIGIWDTSGNLLTSATILAQTGPLVDGWRYTAITPFLLTAGNYVIGGTASNQVDSYAQNATVQNLTGDVTYGTSYANHSGFGLIFPTTHHPDDAGYFGANFQYEVAAVPIPAAIWLFGSGIIGLIGVARRKTS